MTTINGKACVVNGAPVDKVFSNGRQVYGRNIVLNTANFDSHWSIPSQATIVDGYDGHKAIHVDATGLTSEYVNVQQPVYNADVQLIKSGEWYTMSFYAKGTGYIRTYMHPNVIDKSAGSYEDGVFSANVYPNGAHDWALTDKYVRHSLSFKTLTPLSPTTNTGNMLFRSKAGNSAYASLPKLEQGISATPWTPAPEDVMDL